MTEFTLDTLIGHTVAGRYRLDARLHVGLLSAVFAATDTSPEADPAAVLVQLRRPWPDLEPAAPVELHDHHLLGEGFTLDVFVPADVAAAAGETAPARFLVEQTDAGLPEALPEETAPALPTPFEGLVFSAAVLADALDALETDAGFDAESPDHTEPGGRLSVSDTALEMPLFVVDRGEG